MNLVSLSFLVFFFICLVLYYAIPKKAQWGFLLAASVAFYLQSKPVYIVFLLFSILTTYLCALAVNRPCRGKRKAVLAFFLLLNIGLLFAVKYLTYSQSVINILLYRIGADFSLPELSMIVPLGISFYTLQAAGYCIDVYRGKYPPEKIF